MVFRSGIYRGVSLYVGDPVQIPLNGVRITTEEADKDAAVVEISTMVANRSRKKEKLVVTVKFEDDEEHQVYEDRVHLTSFAESQNIVHQKIAIESLNFGTVRHHICTAVPSRFMWGKNCWTNRNSHMESVRSHLMPCGDSGSTESR